MEAGSHSGIHPSPYLHQTNANFRFRRPFWEAIFSVDITSAEGLSKIVAFVHSPCQVTMARSLRDDQAQAFIDLIDRLLTLPHLDQKLFRRCSQLLYKICKARGMLPASYIVTPGLTNVGEFGWGGGFADVSKGRHQGRPVAIKHLKIRTKDGSDNVFKRLCREVLIWKRLSHPNILPLLGVSVSRNPQYFRIVSKWMPNGNVMEYIRSNPKANRFHLLSEVASGVTYLHEIGIAHGDIKGANILIDHAGAARLADFGPMIMTDLSAILLSNTADSSCGTIRWMSPEILDPTRFNTDGLPSRESDCYALGMTIYEVLSGLLPFHHLRFPVVVSAIYRGERPGKPLNALSLGFSDVLWGLLQLCWTSLTYVPPSKLCPTTGGAVNTFGEDTFGTLGASLSGSACPVQ